MGLHVACPLSSPSCLMSFGRERSLRLGELLYNAVCKDKDRSQERLSCNLQMVHMSLCLAGATSELATALMGECRHDMLDNRASHCSADLLTIPRTRLSRWKRARKVIVEPLEGFRCPEADKRQEWHRTISLVHRRMLALGTNVSHERQDALLPSVPSGAAAGGVPSVRFP